MTAALSAIVLELLLIGLMAVFSAAEAALRVARRPGRGALAAVVIGDFFTTFALAAIAAAALAPTISSALSDLGFTGLVSGVSAAVVTVAVVSVLAIVLGVFLPRAIAARYPVGVLRALAWPIRAVSVAFAPVVALLFGATRILARPFGASPDAAALITEEELKALVETGEEQGVIEEEERAMIHSVFAFGEKIARDVMVPRTDIVAVEASTPLRDALELVSASGHSRLPAYRGNADDIIGILYARDLFRAVTKSQVDVPLVELLRPAHFVPETKKVAELLREMQEQKTQLTMVVDEYGGTAGIVTIEDLVEEIVGEIRDEYDVDEERIVAVSDSEAVMDGRVPFDDVRELFDLTRAPSEEYDTLAGFVAHELGHVPRGGDTVRAEGVVFTVESTDDRRARRVRVKREAARTARA